MKSKTGVMLINLGTPNSFKPKDVFKYLIEFLTDQRVIDFSWLKRQLLVRGIIVPLRYRQSAKFYKQIWMKEGSPLLVHGRNVQLKLQSLLGSDYKVRLAMRYQNPSIELVLNELMQEPLHHLVIIPLFPQYASATTGSVYEKVMELIKKQQIIPKLSFVNQFANHQGFLKSFSEIGYTYKLETYDHILFSFHGLPERQIKKSDKNQSCLSENCCEQLNANNQFCYKAQCFATAKGIANLLNLKNYTICFQSRLGRDPWIQPYTLNIIKQLAKEGKKRILVFCPAFVCDCLETTYEIQIEYSHEFKLCGGEHLQLVEGLNSNTNWIETLQSIVLNSANNFENKIF